MSGAATAPSTEKTRGAKRLMAAVPGTATAAAPGTAPLGCTTGDGIGAMARGNVGAAAGFALLGLSAGNLGCPTAVVGCVAGAAKLFGGLLIAFRSGSSSVTPSVDLSEVARITPVLEMDLSNKSSATKLPTR